MKLKHIIGALIVAVAVISGTSVFAAETISVGNPIDITTGAEVTNISDSQYVAFPIDFTSTNGKIKSYNFFLDVNSDVLEPGVTSSVATYFLGSNHMAAISESGKTYYGTSFANEIIPDLAYSQSGYPVINSANNAFAWADDKEWALSADKPELYLLCTVIGDVDYDKLNQKLVTATAGKEKETTVGNGDTEADNVPVEGNVVNACAGAFQVVVDEDALKASGRWLQSITAQSGDSAPVSLVYYVNEDGSSIYKFPARILTVNDGADGKITLTFKTTSDEAGEVDPQETSTVINVSLDGTVTDYQSESMPN